MGDIVRFKKNITRRDDNMGLKEIIYDLETKNRNGYNYTLTDITKLTNDILGNIKYYSGKGATPIVRIAKEFGFTTYKETLKDGKSGDIYIAGETNSQYSCDKVILVNKNEERYHQRFVVAHELAHYLFDYLGNSQYSNDNILFIDTYKKDQHETIQEKRANAFAAEIMMPRELFIKQYNIAIKESNNRIFVLTYLSKFFETSINAIEKRIMEVF